MQSFNLPQAELIYYKNYFTEDYFEHLKSEILWEEKEISLFGKKIMQPRLVAFYGDATVSYSYSGQEMQAVPWSKSLLKIKENLKKGLGLSFNSCLLNYYRTGQDSMGWHQDNEASLGQNPLIASVTFGGARKFKLKHIKDVEHKLDIDLQSKSLLIMAGETQHYYKHALPKTKQKVAPRINLTFRNVL